MFTVVINEKGGEERRQEFDKTEVTIGRVQGNDIVLPKGNVSKRHARIVVKDGKFVVVDLKSTNGTYVNGRKITSPLVIKNTDKIYVGDYVMTVEEGAGVSESVPTAATDADASRRPPPPLPKRKPRGSGEEENATAIDMEEDERLAKAPPVRPPGPALTSPSQSGLPAARREPSAAPSSPRGKASSEQSEPGVVEPLGAAPSKSDFPPAPSGAGIPAKKQTMPPQAVPAMPAIPPRMANAPAAPAPISPAAPMPSKSAIPKPFAPAPSAVPASQAPAFAAAAKAVEGGDGRKQKTVELMKMVLARLNEEMNLATFDAHQLADDTLWEKVENGISDIVEGLAQQKLLPPFITQEQAIKDVLNEALGLGALEDLIVDEAVDRIFVNQPNMIFVEKAGRIESLASCFSSERALITIIGRMMAAAGKTLDEENNLLIDMRLKDGSRLHAILPPAAAKGPVLTIHKIRKSVPSVDQLLQAGLLNKNMADFFQLCVNARRNILVCGISEAGKNAVLNVLGNNISDEERIICLETANALALRQPDVAFLETRGRDANGQGEVTAIDLLNQAVRMRPDRLIMGELRGAETPSFLQAASTSQSGSIAMISASSADEALNRLETMCRFESRLCHGTIARELIVGSFNIVVQIDNYSDNQWRVSRVAELAGFEGESIALQDIYNFRVESIDGNGQVTGKFLAAGYVPPFIEEVKRKGTPVNPNLFRS